MEGEHKVRPYIRHTRVMRRFRRLLLWLPLVVLTTFFAACGWHNWHLSMNEEDVLAAIITFYRSPRKEVEPLVSNAPLPFADGETTLVSVTKNGKVTAPSSPLLERLQTLYPKAHLLANPKPQSDAACSVSLGEIEFINRFQAQCSVRYIRRKTRQLGREEAEELLILERSPSVFRDADWHIHRLSFSSSRSSAE